MSSENGYLGPGWVQTGPGSYELPGIPVTGYNSFDFGSPSGSRGDDFANDPVMMKIAANVVKTISAIYTPLINNDVSAQETNYLAALQLIPADLQKTMEDDKRAGGIEPGNSVANLTSEISTLDKAISQANQEIASLQPVADNFYKGNFFGQPINAFIKEATARELYHEANRNVTYDNWQESLQAAYKIKHLNNVVDVATTQKNWLTLQLQRVVQQQAVFKTVGTLAMPANANAITVSGQGLIQVVEGAASLAQAIADGIAALGRIAIAGPGAYIATILTLGLYSSPTVDGSQDRTPDRIRYGFGLKAEQLGLPPGTNLQSIALAQGSVELPWRLTNEAKGDRSAISVISADGVSVPKGVPVRAATLNPTTGLYEVVLPTTIPDQPPITLTWTPTDAPGSENPSSTTPVVTQEIPVYTGTMLQPITVEAESYPGLFINPDDLITWFPAESGIAPIYVMFSEPLDSGIFTRRQLQKKFDSHKEDFGLEGQNATNKTLAEFRDRILTHLGDPATIQKGTYHSSPNSKVYFNPNSNLVIIVGIDGMFISGWKIQPGTDQYDFYMESEVL